jgi:hypothetical protein
MFTKRTFRMIAQILTIVAVFALSVAYVAPAAADDGPKEKTDDRGSVQVSRNPSLWWWGDEAGKGKVYRYDYRFGSGVFARLNTSVAIPEEGVNLSGKAMTMWIVVFNNPNACTTGPGVPKCTDQDVFFPDGSLNTDVQADFLYGGGRIARRGKVRIFGHVRENGPEGLNGTGLGELVCRIQGDACADPDDINTPGLQNPEGAEIHLVLHDHGKAMTGADLWAQLTTFLGGCPGLPNPFPTTGPGDLMDCQSIQFSVHQVP